MPLSTSGALSTASAFQPPGTGGSEPCSSAYGGPGPPKLSMAPGSGILSCTARKHTPQEVREVLHARQLDVPGPRKRKSVCEREARGAHRPVEATVAVAATGLDARDDLRYGVGG
jgi:hypothetical protein